MKPGLHLVRLGIFLLYGISPFSHLWLPSATTMFLCYSMWGLEVFAESSLSLFVLLLFWLSAIDLYTYIRTSLMNSKSQLRNIELQTFPETNGPHLENIYRCEQFTEVAYSCATVCIVYLTVKSLFLILSVGFLYPCLCQRCVKLSFLDL